jgi:hypothetical protein
MNTYKYNIQEIRCEPTLGELSKVVTEVVYEYIGESESGVISKISGMVSLEEPLVDSFTPIDSIEESIIVSWIEPKLDIDLFKKMIDEEIKYKSGFIYKGDSLPWNINNLQ